MKSMTGYGRGECTLYNRRFVVEIKAVNHRYNDITIKLPRAMIMFEDKLKKLISNYVSRGKTDVFVQFETFSSDDVNISVNEPLADSYFKALEALKERLGLDSSIDLSLVAKFPDIISVDKNVATDSASSEIWECLENAANEAIRNFIDMRQVEGEALKNNILQKTEFILELVKKIELRAPEVSKDYRERLMTKLSELKELNVDEGRVLTEVMLFADKACIDEEITRLYSHIEQMNSIVEEKNPVGRKLDFLVQEMNREVNTIGSKSNDLTITNLIVDAKSEIEKIREQIQNIE